MPSPIIIDRVYPIISTRTGHVYISEDAICFAFLNEKDAAAFSEKESKRLKYPIKPDAPRKYELTDLLAKCYAAGGRSLILADKDKKEEFPINVHQLPSAYYNNQGNFRLDRIKTTKKESELHGIERCRFLVPCMVDNEHLEVYYCTARIPGMRDYVYTAFTDLDEYRVWAVHNPRWSPLELGFAAMMDIGKNHGFIINPAGNKFLFTKEILEQIAKGPGK